VGKFWGKLAVKLKRVQRKVEIPQLPNPFPQVFHQLGKTIHGLGASFSTSSSETLLLLLLLLLFPANLAKHFVTSQSYVLGNLIDYLSPAIYLTEVLTFLLLVVNLSQSLRTFRIRPKLIFLLVGLFLLSLLPSVQQSSYKVIAFFRFGELSLWLAFSLWVAYRLPWKSHPKLFQILGLGVAWVSLVALGQFFLQHHLLGYWFLGEPTLTPSLGGVAKGSFLGREVVRAYGTFPHPNVLGGVLSVILGGLFTFRFWGPFVLGLGGILVSLSRAAWFSLIGGLLGLAFFGQKFGVIFLNDLSVSRRWELIQSAGEMIKSSPLTGVGLGQFVAQLPRFGIPSGLSLFLQPVHNIFALVAAESGLFSALLFGLIILFAFREAVRKRRFLLAVLLLQLIFLGMIDHYLYTLPQGLFLLSLIIGLSFSYSES